MCNREGEAGDDYASPSNARQTPSHGGCISFPKLSRSLSGNHQRRMRGRSPILQIDGLICTDVALMMEKERSSA